METSNYNENKMGVMPINKLLITVNGGHPPLTKKLLTLSYLI